MPRTMRTRGWSIRMAKMLGMLGNASAKLELRLRRLKRKRASLGGKRLIRARSGRFGLQGKPSRLERRQKQHKKGPSSNMWMHPLDMTPLVQECQPCKPQTREKAVRAPLTLTLLRRLQKLSGTEQQAHCIVRVRAASTVFRPSSLRSRRARRQHHWPRPKFLKHKRASPGRASLLVLRQWQTQL